MRFDDTAPLVVNETRKVAPCPEARQNAVIPAVLGLTCGAVAALAGGMIAICLGWPAATVAGIGGLAMLVGIAVGLGRFERLTLTVEESTQYSETPPAAVQAVNWELRTEPGQLMRGTLIADPALVIDWARAAIGQQSLSYATWGEKWGGERKYAVYRRRLVDSGLAIEQGRELALTRKGWALFTTVAERGSSATPLLQRSPLLQAPEASEIQ